MCSSDLRQLLSLIALDDNDLWEIIAGRSNNFPEGSDHMVTTLCQTRANH